ncbi:MAG TPA: thiol-disulfide oxidoreductase DCC family protein [Tepidisphaeraceae bacterium]|jgi:predicted DCC family thiol-disulfide oxidoreductase YuxK|nr:thiol-disulfide oxidoreductase DCC family protein [Tepidisphaeraceae bacterium]
MPAAPPRQSLVVLFDGQCNLCNGAVNFLIDRDHGRRFKFASQQSAAGKELLASYDQPINLKTLVVIDRGQAFTRSAAVLRLVRHLPFPWPLLQVGVAIPRPIADWLYDRVAGNRYRLFGRSDACRMPTPELADRFLG